MSTPRKQKGFQATDRGGKTTCQNLSPNLWGKVVPQIRTHSCKGAALSNGCPGPGDEEVSSITRAKGPERERAETGLRRRSHRHYHVAFQLFQAALHLHLLSMTA